MLSLSPNLSRWAGIGQIPAVQPGPYAASRIGELLIESNSRGYWKADQQRLQQVRDIVIDLESGLE